MSNEELVHKIQTGERELLPELWTQVERFIRMKAHETVKAAGGSYFGLECEDLYDAGYIAMVNAVESYDETKETLFLTHLKWHLRHTWNESAGIHSNKQRNDPILHCLSLDSPLGEDPDGATMGDLLEDPSNQIGKVEQSIWLEQLSNTISQALDDLPESQRETLYKRYWKNQTFKEMSEAAGVYSSTVREWEKKALQWLRRKQHMNGLDQFIEERTSYYYGLGIGLFRVTQTSPVEQVVIKRDKMRISFIKHSLGL